MLKLIYMGKIPYVLKCEMFARVGFDIAEDLLAEYNDFVIYNKAQYDIVQPITDEFSDTEELNERDLEKKRLVAEHNARVAVDTFTKWFGNKDFAESVMVGFHPDWYELQNLLSGELKLHISPHESKMNKIAPRLLSTARVMLYAEYMSTALSRFEHIETLLTFIKDGFASLLEQSAEKVIELPEFYKQKREFAKFKKPEQYLAFCEKIFFKGTAE